MMRSKELCEIEKKRMDEFKKILQTRNLTRGEILESSRITGYTVAVVEEDVEDARAMNIDFEEFEKELEMEIENG